ncbi:MAG: DUF4143 domain-containing protein, partial [Proteobacteria bacterium]|nr:DUF4143 domain-containing protein [Pseudomonadota bacterium]
SPNVYFYRDHYGVEVDFVIPVADRLKLIECKWSETPGIPKGFEQLQTLTGAHGIASKTVVVPTRGHRTLGDMSIEDPVDLTTLEH